MTASHQKLGKIKPDDYKQSIALTFFVLAYDYSVQEKWYGCPINLV